MKVEILKSDGAHTYEVPLDGKTVTVMDILDDIYERLDHTLAYYRHSSCNQGICGRCLVKANGKNVLACTAQIGPETPYLLLEPARKDAVVRDLVIAI